MLVLSVLILAPFFYIDIDIDIVIREDYTYSMLKHCKKNRLLSFEQSKLSLSQAPRVRAKNC